MKHDVTLITNRKTGKVTGSVAEDNYKVWCDTEDVIMKK